MQKSNWREEIELNEFVDDRPKLGVAGLVGLGLNVGKALVQTSPQYQAVKTAAPLVQKGFKTIKKKATDLLTPKVSKDIIDKVKPKAQPKVDSDVDGKGFNPKGFTPSKEIENERQKLIKQRELEKIKKKDLDRLKPRKIETNPKIDDPKKVENPSHREIRMLKNELTLLKKENRITFTACLPVNKHIRALPKTYLT